MSPRLMRRVLGLESLETRRVLAASVLDGVLTVEGTKGNDKIWINLSGELADQVRVQINKSVTFFTLSEVTEIRVHAGAGNDRVVVADDVLVNAHIDGGKGNDWLKGGGGNDVVLGGLGNDHADGGAGDDALAGNSGNDKLVGGLGNDGLDGGAGADHLKGGDGDDLLAGGDGHDHLNGGAGCDDLSGGNGHDQLNGGDGDDLVHGDAGHDIVHGGLGNDELFGDAGHDLIYGGAGDDWIDGGDGKDKLWGNLGDDSIKGGLGNDHLDGGAGNNLLDGDEGKNKLKNGTEVDLDAPPPPDDPSGEPEYVTELSGDGVFARIVYRTAQLGEGIKETLEFTITGLVPGAEVPILIDGRVFGIPDGSDTVLPVADANGNLHIKFSTVPDQSDEVPFPDSFWLTDQAEVVVGDLVGLLNLSQAAS